MKYFNKPPLGTPLNPTHPLNRGLVGYWGFGEGAGSKTHDLSGKGNHGTLTNMVQGATSGWSGGKFGGAMTFDGANDFVDCGSAQSLDFGLNNFSISIWVFLNSYTDGGGIIQKNEAAGQKQWYIRQNNALGQIRWITFDGTSAVLIDTANDFLPLRTWVHFVGVRHNTGMILYKNGGASTAAGTALDVTNSVTARIGRGPGGLVSNGLISETRIYNRALSAQEVQQLYTDPFCMYEQKSNSRFYLPVVQNTGNFFQLF